MSYTVSFTLKQHTPLIHFQAEQMGATIRATELKPKLDRFLLEKIPNLPHRNSANGHNNLDYKVKIRALDIPKKFLYKTYIPKKDRSNKSLKEGAYFGDNYAILNKQVEIKFFSFKPDILNAIREYFVDFILTNNFGNRQNKGFGSFSVTQIDNKPTNYSVDDILLQYYPKIYKANSQQPLKKILNDYQLLKSGKNNPYEKSYLFQYMCNHQIRWEKRMIKEYMEEDFNDIFKELKYEHKPIECERENSNFTYQYIRGLLGVAEYIEFLKTAPKDKKDKIHIDITAQNRDIERFKSPITFKVVDNTIYVLATNDIPIRGERFEFKIKGQKNRLNEYIEIPREFDIFDFLDFGLNQKLNYQIKANR